MGSCGWGAEDLPSGNREIVTTRAHLDDDICAALAGAANTVACVEGGAPFPHPIDAGVPQGDFRGRIRWHGDLEHESLPPPVELPGGLQRPVRRFERRARTRQPRSGAWCDA